jgi:hypothetical protein
MAALLATCLATFRDYRKVLSPGEVATIAVIAADRRQARTIHRYISALLNQTPMLARMVDRQNAENISLTNMTAIEIHTASFRTARGYTLAGAVCDEIGFWRSEESACPDSEILNALRPGMVTIPGSLLIALSSPYAKRGELYQAFRRYWGQDGETLVWKADSRTMNPTLSGRVIERAYDRDSAAARSEWGAEFRSDLETYLPVQTVEQCVIPGRTHLPYSSEFRYAAFCDPSGGSKDSMTMAVGHAEERGGRPRVVVDCIREHRPPFNPDTVVSDLVGVLEAYRIRQLTGDRYAGEWVAQKFREGGVTYRPARLTRSELYEEFGPLVTAGHVELPDNRVLVAQLSSLERRTGRNRDVIDHAPGAHDDVANAVAGVAAELAGQSAARTRAITSLGVW